MTIKKRLFRSNVLMIVLPIFLSIFISVVTIFLVYAISGESRNVNDNDKYIGINEKELQKYTESGSYEDPVSVKLYLSDKGENLLVFGDNQEIPAVLVYNKNHRALMSIFIIILVVLLVYIINTTLTRYVFKSIMTPIDILTKGVHEIRDGNLSYRIEYDGKDEFLQVCNDFNEMAAKLLEMVNCRQRDEQNRRELIAGISHDLRTPLTSIKAYIEGIEKGVANTPEKHKKYIDIIKSKTADLEYIINQLFLFSKLDIGDFPLNMTEVKIGDEIRVISGEYANENTNNGLKVEFEDNTFGAKCMADSVQLKNVILNILGNSMKYKEKDVVHAKITCFLNNEDVEIDIADDGPGVENKNLERIFDVFYRVDESRRKPAMGNGLGLAISSKIIQRFGGTIKAASNDVGGLTICIMLKKSGLKTNDGGNIGEKNTDN